MAKFTSKRLSRDVSYDSAAERAFRKSLRNKRTSYAVEKYLDKRGKKGYSKKSFKKWMRQEHMKDYGHAMGKVGEEKFKKYMDEYEKKTEKEIKKISKSNQAAAKLEAKNRTQEKLQKAAALRKKRKAAQQKRKLREEFSSTGKLSAPTRATREGLDFDPRAGVKGPRSASGARSGPHFDRGSSNLRPQR